MEAKPTKVMEYFNGQKQNLIPLFQRPYTWSQKNWQTLWDDIKIQIELNDGSSHFMGAIVSVPARSVPVGVSKYLIIDGQQRLTTISILLCALRDCSEHSVAEKIHNLYLTNQYTEKEDTLKFVPTQADREEYCKLVLDKIQPNNDSKLLAAYNFFRKKINDDTDSNDTKFETTKILEILVQSLEVVMINLSENDDPYLIFESLNFKGEPLTQADLVRNYILMRFKHSISQGGEQEKIYNLYWRPIEQLLSQKDDLTEFLRHYMMKDGKDIKHKGIYSEVKEKLKSSSTAGDTEKELQEMLSYAKHYSCFLNPQTETDPTIQKRILNIRNLNVTTAYPLMLRLFNSRLKAELNKNDLADCLRLIESYIVRRSICGIPANSLNKFFNQLAKAYPANDHLTWIKTSLSSASGGARFPTDEEFKDAFISQYQYGKSNTKFVLSMLEKSFNHKEETNLESTTIEHIMPQTLNEQWIQTLGENNVSVHEKWIDTFGNLSLTGYNSELGNLPFAEKKAKLSNTHIELNRAILETETWGPKEIQLRAESLFSKSKEIWGRS